jgi:hypothetical protein
METIEFEGKTLLINPGGDCPGCHFEKSPICDIKSDIHKGVLNWYCIKHKCNFKLKEDGKPV